MKPITYLKYPLLSSPSARLLIDDIRTSSYPRKFCNMNCENESPKHAFLLGSSTKICTVRFNFCLVAGDNRRNPYSKLYSTIYSSSGHTKNANYMVGIIQTLIIIDFIRAYLMFKSNLTRYVPTLLIFCISDMSALRVPISFWLVLCFSISV